MIRATPVQMRKALEAVEHFKKSGIRFVPMPVRDDADHDAMVAQMMDRLPSIEEKVDALHR